MEGETAVNCLASKAGDRDAGSTMLIFTLLATAGLFSRLLVSALKMFFLKFYLEALSYLLGEGPVICDLSGSYYSFSCYGLGVATCLLIASLENCLLCSNASLRSLCKCFALSGLGVFNAPCSWWTIVPLLCLPPGVNCAGNFCGDSYFPNIVFTLSKTDVVVFLSPGFSSVGNCISSSGSNSVSGSI